MSTITWHDGLHLDLPAMDTTHREFVDLLAQVQAADDADLVRLWDVLVDHTVDHFGQEDRWMQATRFAAGNCHATQHMVVLQVMRAGARMAHDGQPEVLRRLADELADWFPQHALSMDSALAAHLAGVGLDLATGCIARPHAMPDVLIEGRGSESCGSPAPTSAHEPAHAPT